MGIHKQCWFYWVVLVLSAFLLSGCGGGDSGSVSPPEADNVVDPISDGSAEQPSSGGELHMGQLIYKFQRKALIPDQQPQNAQKHNEEIVGRPFLINLYRLSDDGSEVEDITEQVNWASIQENCPTGSCYKVGTNSELIGLNEGTFTAQATFGGETSVPITFEVKGKLEVCGLVDNTDKTQSILDECLHIVEGTTGDAAQKWFTEPPSVGVMSNVLRYSFDSSYSNEGYTHGGYLGAGIPYASMTNYGHPMGQYARYCADLASIRFAERDNWRRATKPEFDALLSNQDVSATYGWNGQSFFATSTMSGGQVEAVNYWSDMALLYWNQFDVSEKLLATCVSEP